MWPSWVKPFLEFQSDPTVVLDNKSNIVYKNAAFESFKLRLFEDDKILLDLNHIFSQKEWEEVREIPKQKNNRRIRKLLRSEDGGTLTLKMDIIPYKASDNQDFSIIILQKNGKENNRLAAIKNIEELAKIADFANKNSREMLFWLDEKGNFLRVNSVSYTDLGYEAKEMENMTIFDINPSLTPESWRKSFESMKVKKHYIFETTHRRKDGKDIRVEVNANYLELNDMKLSVGFARNIDKDKNQQEIIFKSYSKLIDYKEKLDFSNEIIKYAPVGIALVNKEGIIEKINPEVCEQLQLKEKDITNRKLMQFSPFKENMDEVWISFLQKMRGEKALIYEANPKAYDGRGKKFEIKVFYFKQKEVEKLILFSWDISIRDKYIKELQESEERYMSIVEQSTDIILIVKDYRLLFANSRMQNFIGKDQEKIVSSKIDDFVFDEDVPVLYEKMNSIKHNSPKNKCRIRLLNSKEENVYMDVTIGSIIYHNERAFLISAHDISEHLEYEKKLSKALNDLKQMSEKVKVENVYLRKEIRNEYNFGNILSKNKEIKKILDFVDDVAKTKSAVLIYGETGTGKELIARAIHANSLRSDKPLLKLNCSAFPADLIESELFGHEKGSFTGAIATKIGKFEAANGGTLFLDEIGELPLELQPKLLRVLQDGEFEKVGSNKTIRVDVRIISATNRNLENEIEKNQFRRDLYYRLNVFPIHVPPLRERKEDIPILTSHFVEKFSKRIGKKITKIPKEVIDNFMNYSWPGNIRELENIIERAIIISKSQVLDVKDDLVAKDITHKIADDQVRTLEEVERDYIRHILNITKGRVSGEKGAAKILGMNRTTLEARMKKLGIDK